MKIALLVIATNKYYDFVESLYESVKAHLFANEKEFYQVDVYVFTDKATVPNGCHYIYQEHLPWPHITLKRFQMFSSIHEKLSKYEYIYYCDADMLLLLMLEKKY